MFCVCAHFVFLLLSCFCWCDHTPGVLQLDSKTFDKVVQTFDYVFVKFSGDHFEDKALGEVADALGGNLKAIVAEVRLETAPESAPPNYEEYYDDYPSGNEKEPEPMNTDLAEKYQIKKEDWPVYKLFKRSHLERPETFQHSNEDESPTAEDFKKFLKSKRVYIGLAGCLKEMDEFVVVFRDPAVADRSMVLEKAKKRMEMYTDEFELSNAKIYITYMQKIIEKGDAFIESEAERLKRLLDGEMSEAKRAEVTKRANVIDTFHAAARKDEL